MRILIGGASVATLCAATRLCRLLPRAEILIVNRRAQILHRRNVPHILSGLHSFPDERIDIAKFCERHGLRFHLGDITEMNIRERSITVGEQRLSYDAILLDLPSEPTTAHEPGAETALTLAGEASAHVIKDHVLAQLERAAREAQESNRTIVIVGAGHRGIETAAELHELRTGAASKHFIFPNELHTILIKAQGDGSEHIPSRAHASIDRELERRGVQARAPTHVSYGQGRITIDGHLTETGTIVWTASERGNRLFISSGITVDEEGYALVDHALRTSDDRVFAVGHSIHSIGDVRFPNHRRAGDLVREGHAAAHNIAATLLGKHLQPLKNAGKVPSAITLGKTAVGWFGPFVLHSTLPYRLHRNAERNAVESIHER